LISHPARSLGCLGALALLACAHASNPDLPPRTSPARYFPLAVGNRWTYKAAGPTSDAVEEVEIRGVKDGRYQDNRGRMLWVSADGLRDQSRVLLRSPVETGRSWTVTLGPESVEHWRIVSVGEACSAPAGQFSDCVQVESRIAAASGAELVNRITFAAEVGIVQIRTALVRGGKETPQTSLLLVSYQVAPLRPPPAG
jgi:hypothetical protein